MEGGPWPRQDTVIGATVFFLHSRKPTVKTREKARSETAGTRQHASPTRRCLDLRINVHFSGIIVFMIHRLEKGRAQGWGKRKSQKS